MNKIKKILFKVTQIKKIVKNKYLIYIKKLKMNHTNFRKN